jgi:hypothetical protein
MPQSEKDRLGAEARKAEARAERRRRGVPVDDADLDSLDRQDLLAEAELRGVPVKTGATDKQIVAALRGQQEGDK